MKYLILVGDGMGDRPLPELGGRTPLAAAKTPAMDALASRAVFYRLQTVPPGMHPGSDVANLSLLGYRPEECYTGRAPLEAASLGVALGQDDVAMRMNLVTVHPKGEAVFMDDYSAGHISTAEASELVRELATHLAVPGLEVHPGVSYRHLLVLRGIRELDLATVPPHDHTGEDVSSFRQVLLHHPLLGTFVRRAEELLADHPVNQARLKQGKKPANSVWLWGQGRAPEMPRFEELYGATGALISAVDLLKGIGVYAGLEVVTVPGATGYLDTNYQGKVEAALDALDRHDLVFVHVEAPDETSHQGDLALKLKAIEDFDAKVVAPVVQGLERHDITHRMVVTMDHFTPLSLKTHTDDPVPLLLADSRREGRDALFSETEAASSPLLHDPRAFMNLFLKGKER